MEKSELCIVVCGDPRHGFTFHGPFLHEGVSVVRGLDKAGCLTLESSDWEDVPGEPGWIVVNTNEPSMPWQVHGPFEDEEAAMTHGGFDECGVWWALPLDNSSFRDRVVRVVLKETVVAEAA